MDPVVDFGRFRGRRIAVLGANASAFDNAGTALEAGVATVTMFARRAFLPQVNKTRGMVFGIRQTTGASDTSDSSSRLEEKGIAETAKQMTRVDGWDEADIR